MSIQITKIDNGFIVATQVLVEGHQGPQQLAYYCENMDAVCAYLKKLVS